MTALLERDHCLEHLRSALREVVAGQGRVALISGEAGIGKTSLVDQFVRTCCADVRMLWGSCDAYVTPRLFGPLHDVASQVSGNLAGLLAAGNDRAAIFAALLAELQARPTVAIIEDVHWADDTTLDLLRFLGRRIGRTTSLLLLTYRDDELGPRHPLRTVLGDLASSLTSYRIPLAPLSLQAVQTLTRGRPIDTAQLHSQTGGNPFFVTEVLAGGGAGLPQTIQDAVLGRVARLSPSAQAVLKAAAVIGARIEPWLLDEVMGAEAIAVEEAQSAGMLVAQGDLLTFRHELARRTVLAAITPTHRASLHRMTLEALRASPRARSDPARLAQHAAAADDGEAVLAYAPVAARQASSAGAHRQAAALYALALDCAADLPVAEQAALTEAYAWESHVSGNVAVACSARRRAAELWQTTGNRLKQGENLCYLAIILTSTTGIVEAEAVVRTAIDLLETLPPGRELALAARTLALIHQGNHHYDEAITLAERAIELASAAGDSRVQAMAYDTLGSAWIVRDYARGRHYLQQGLALAESINLQPRVANIYGNLGASACELYELADAEQDLASGLAYTAERDLDLVRPYLLAWQALTHLHRGRWAAAETAANEVRYPTNGSTAPVDNLAAALIALGRLKARRGDLDTMAVLDEALDLATRSGDFKHLVPARAARAEAAWLAGEPERVLAEVEAVFELAVARRHPWLAGELAFWRWRAGGSGPWPTWLATPFAQQIAGDWQAAAAAWAQRGCPYERARALADGGATAQTGALVIFEQLGAQPAAASLRRALRASGVTHLPRGPRASTRANDYGLTMRQMDILARLAQGCSNAEIAAHLSIAPKTVDHHVSAVLAKLAVTSRREAVAVAQARGLLPEK